MQIFIPDNTLHTRMENKPQLKMHKIKWFNHRAWCTALKWHMIIGVQCTLYRGEVANKKQLEWLCQVLSGVFTAFIRSFIMIPLSLSFMGILGLHTNAEARYNDRTLNRRKSLDQLSVKAISGESLYVGPTLLIHCRSVSVGTKNIVGTFSYFFD